MAIARFRSSIVFVLTGSVVLRAAVACDLQVQSGWIREAPPGSRTVAAYALLKNSGDKTITITTISSPAATTTTLHESTVTDGISRMRMLPSINIAAGATLILAPGSKHLMLTGVENLPLVNEQVAIAFTDASGCVTRGDFIVRAISSD